MVPMNWTLIPVCSNLFPSFGRIVTAPFTDSPSLYSGAFSLRPFSVFISTICRSSPSSRTISMSTGVEKKYAILTVPHSRPSERLGDGNGRRASWVEVGQELQASTADSTSHEAAASLSARAAKRLNFPQGSLHTTTEIHHNSKSSHFLSK